MCISKESGFIMGAGDAFIGIAIIGIFFFIIGSRIHAHEKEHLDPLIDKIKGWFHKDEDSSDEGFDPSADYDLAFKGQLS